MVWALILAAGKSRRMGRPKLLLPWARSTIIETVIQTALDSRADQVCVVLGSHKTEIEEKIIDLPVIRVHNRDFSKGMLSSIQAGIKGTPDAVKAICLCLGDQPHIPSRIIDLLMEVHAKTGKGIVLPVHKGQRGHPILIDMKYRKRILSLHPTIGLIELLHLHPEDVATVEVDSQSILADIDTPEDYRDQSKIFSAV